MTRAQLFQFFKDNGITTEELAEKTGYAPLYIANVLYGSAVLNDRMRFRIMQVFPATADFLLSDDAPDNGDESHN